METLGKYKLIKKIGTGGMAEVYLAQARGAQDIHKILVIKKILPVFSRNAHFISMFVDEAKIATKLNHPNIIQVYGFEQVDQDYILTMEYVDGADLTRTMNRARKENKPIPHAISAFIIQEVAKGLYYAHNRKDERGEHLEIVHRDVSPHNILLSYEGVVKIGDFGIAKAKLLSDEPQGLIKGKFAYMSPEQSAGKIVDYRTDIYSLGIVLYELLLGKPVIHGNGFGTVVDKLKKIEIPNVDEELISIIKIATAQNPDDRYQSAKDMAYDIAKYLHKIPAIIDSAFVENFLKGLIPPKSLFDNKEDNIHSIKENLIPTEAFAQHRLPTKTTEKRNVVLVMISLSKIDGYLKKKFEKILPKRKEEYFKIIEEIAYKYDGIIEKFDENLIAIYLGLPFSSEIDSFKAIMMSLDIEEAAEGMGYDIPFLKPEIGINRGQVVCILDNKGKLVKFDPLGSLNIITRKLVLESEPGEIKIGGGVYRITRNEFNYEELTPISVNNITIETDSQGTNDRFTLKIYRLLGPKKLDDILRNSLNKQENFYGRDLELKNLDLYLKELIDRKEGYFISIVGEMGIGKTSLVAEFLKRISGYNCKVIHTYCRIENEKNPFSIFVNLLKELFEIKEEDLIDDIHYKIDKHIKVLFDKNEKNDVLKFNLFQLLGYEKTVEQISETISYPDLIEDIFGTAIKKDLIIFIIDNVQYADQQSLEIIKNISKRKVMGYFLFLVVGRPNDRVTSYLRDLPRITMRELSPQCSMNIIFEKFGDKPIVRDLAEKIYNKTGGNPFFIKETLDSLLDKGIISLENGNIKIIKGSKLVVPTTLEDLSSAKIDYLPDDERLILRWMSVIGGNFNIDLLNYISGGKIDQILLKLLQKGFIDRNEESGQSLFSFKYEFVREVAYEGLLKKDREIIHRRIIDWIKSQPDFEKSYVLKLKVAYHLEKIGNSKESIMQYIEAARLAKKEYNFLNALKSYNKVLKILVNEPETAFRIHCEREEVYSILGLTKERINEIDKMQNIAQAMGNISYIVKALNKRAKIYIELEKLNNAEQILKIITSAYERTQDPFDRIDILKLKSKLAYKKGDYITAKEYGESALSLINSITHDWEVRAELLVELGKIDVVSKNVDYAMKKFAEALVIYDKTSNKQNQSMVMFEMGMAVKSNGGFEDAIVLLTKAIKIDLDIDNKINLIDKIISLINIYLYIGDIDNAIIYSNTAKTICEQNKNLRKLYELIVIQGEMYLSAGYLEESDKLIKESLTFERDVDEISKIRGLLLQIKYYIEKNELKRAAEYAETCLNLYENNKKINMAFDIILYLLYVYNILEDENKYCLYFEKYKQYLNNIPLNEERNYLLYFIYKKINNNISQEYLLRAYNIINENKKNLRDEKIKESYLQKTITNNIIKESKIIFSKKID